MKKIIFLLLIILGVSCNQESQHTKNNHAAHSTNPQNKESEAVISDTAKGSPLRMAMANLGSTHIHIEYNSPAVRKRIIWGGLVAFDQVWVTGAHNATSISFSKDVKIADKTILKGKYAFFTIPSQTEWTLILNKNWDQHLTDEYSEKEDVLRWKVKPTPAEHTERLSYQIISKDQNHASIEMTWEKIKISFKITQ